MYLSNVIVVDLILNICLFFKKEKSAKDWKKEKNIMSHYAKCNFRRNVVFIINKSSYC